jgi:hypothetical protein
VKNTNLQKLQGKTTKVKGSLHLSYTFKIPFILMRYILPPPFDFIDYQYGTL